MDPRTGRTTAIAAGVILLTALTAGCVVTSVRSAGDDSSITGPEWKTTARRGAGAATAAAPAQLTGVAVEDHERYDRVVFTFDGERPGYRVGYGSPAGQAGDPRLVVTLSNTESRSERRLEPHLPTVRGVHQLPAAAGVVDTVVTLDAGTGSDRVSFRVGLSVGQFYVDLPHADEKP
ncbi:hypothetical protein [Krasilnikovia sp. M28-CT-15]|uniref:AMIN-like domain-containing (lipo)protein n=1 Tax=Krasilnikovia sp. M28-CT-15 TaxID=3373540 RepID=UPI003875C88F